MDLVPQNSSLYHLIYGGLAAIAWILSIKSQTCVSQTSTGCWFNQFGQEAINREGRNFDRNLLLLWTKQEVNRFEIGGHCCRVL